MLRVPPPLSWQERCVVHFSFQSFLEFLGCPGDQRAQTTVGPHPWAPARKSAGKCTPRRTAWPVKKSGNLCASSRNPLRSPGALESAAMRYFKSDNTAAVSREILDALGAANSGASLAYGADRWSERLDAV